jgi:hypothetical protein
MDGQGGWAGLLPAGLAGPVNVTCGSEEAKLPKAQVANARWLDMLLQPRALPPVQAAAAAMPVCVAGAHEIAGEDVYILVRSQI